MRPLRQLRGQASAVTTGAYGRLRALILSGGLAPGAPLIETDLSLRLGVSRTPIRAALQRLQQEGFVVATRVGQLTRAIVTPLTTIDMREVHYMVGALEGLSARLAAGLPSADRTALATRMEKINTELRAAVEGRPPEIPRAQDLHVRLHRAPVEAAAGRRLLGELDALHPQAERYERVYTAFIDEAGLRTSLQEHDEIVRAIRGGDAEAAERAATANWRNGADRYRPIVAMLGERGSW